MPSPNEDLMAELVACWVVEPDHAGYPRSAVSKNIESGRFLWVRLPIHVRSLSSRCCDHDAFIFVVGNGFKENFILTANERLVIHSCLFGNQLHSILGAKIPFDCFNVIVSIGADDSGNWLSRVLVGISTLNR